MKIIPTSLRLATIFFAITVLFACKKKTDVPGNEITESSNLEIFTSWSLNDNSSATVGADLDVVLVRGNITSESQFAGLSLADIIDFSDNSGDFETMKILSSLPDGDYSVIIDYYDIKKAGRYTIRFKGSASGKIYTIADIAFTVAEDGSVKFPVKITKAGQKFTITKR